MSVCVCVCGKRGLIMSIDSFYMVCLFLESNLCTVIFFLVMENIHKKNDIRMHKAF